MLTHSIYTSLEKIKIFVAAQLRFIFYFSLGDIFFRGLIWFKSDPDEDVIGRMRIRTHNSVYLDLRSKL